MLADHLSKSRLRVLEAKHYINVCMYFYLLKFTVLGLGEVSGSKRLSRGSIRLWGEREAGLECSTCRGQ